MPPRISTRLDALGARAVGGFGLSHLKLTQTHLGFVSLFDDTEDVWREEDFQLVEGGGLSEIARWSRPDEFERILRAA